MSELQMHNICDLSTVRVYLSSLDVRPSSLLRMLRKVRMVDPTKFNPGTGSLRDQGKTRRNRKTREYSSSSLLQRCNKDVMSLR